MTFDDPFTHQTITLPGSTPMEMFEHLCRAATAEEPHVHDAERVEDCSVCGPLLAEAIIADFRDELEAA